MSRFAPLPPGDHQLPGRLLVAAGGLFLAALFVGCGDRHDHRAESTPAVNHHDGNRSTDATSAKADNTAKNERDRDGAVTPLDQGNSEADIATTQAIRKAVVADKTLSVNAQNVKIITNNGVVTLRGPVNSEAERTAVVAAAQRVSGVRTVHNHLEVAH